MLRREFLKTSAVATVLGSILPQSNVSAQPASQPSGREFYELRLYHLRAGPQVEGFDRFYREAAIPAFNRAGVERVGVFSAMAPADPENPTMYVLLTHSSLESVGTTTDRLLADSEYLKAGAAFINARATAPSYVRVDSSLMGAFGLPKLKAPDFGDENQSRLFELRTYESPSKKANKKKIGMFEQGEIAIFLRVGLQPVFFGETLIGSRLPNLTYMLTFKNQAAKDQAWKAFGADADWKKLRAMPGNADKEIVSKITSTMLHPAPYSQI
ncbi:MAG TPA: NIPSNAP family protein [Candidatus Saccharimonadales bacterium]|nr:NIPSNAP family protein [Candidatus Saccharimonadales bacterium]